MTSGRTRRVFKSFREYCWLSEITPANDTLIRSLVHIFKHFNIPNNTFKNAADGNNAEFRSVRSTFYSARRPPSCADVSFARAARLCRRVSVCACWMWLSVGTWSDQCCSTDARCLTKVRIICFCCHAMEIISILHPTSTTRCWQFKLASHEVPYVMLSWQPSV